MTLKLYSRLSFYARGEMVLHQRHLRDQIGGGDQFGLGVPSGDDDVQIRPARRQCGKNIRKLEVVVAECDIELVEDDQCETRIGQKLAPFRPGALRSGDVAG